MATTTVPPHIAEGCLTPPSLMTRLRATVGAMTILMIIILSVTLTHCNMSRIAWVGIGLLALLLLFLIWSSSADGVLFKYVLKNCKETNEYSVRKSAIMIEYPSMTEAEAGLRAEEIMRTTKLAAQAEKDAAKLAERQAKLARKASKRRKS